MAKRTSGKQQAASKAADKTKNQGLAPAGGGALASSSGKSGAIGGRSKDDIDKLLGDVPKRPTAKELVGGQSWTGKLPNTLLNEYCARKGWMAVQVNNRQVDGNFNTASVTLRKKDPKTGAISQVPPIRIPDEYKAIGLKPTAVEARNVAAAYALFRLNSSGKLYVAMPPQFRDLWKNEFQQMKASDETNHKDWMYEADPFKGFQEREQRRAVRDEEMRKRQEQVKADAAARVVDLRFGGADGPAAAAQPTRAPRSWDTAPAVELADKIRDRIEGLLQRRIIWNLHEVRIKPARRKVIIEELTKSGFRPSHVQEAVDICGDKEETLDWLLIHVPEDDLPKWCLPPKYTAGIRLQSSDLRQQTILDRLTQAGYPLATCKRAFNRARGDEHRAMEYLQATLIRDMDDAKNELSLSRTKSTEVWTEELEALQAIHGDLYSSLSDDGCEIRLEPDKAPFNISVQFRRPTTLAYPQAPPIMRILTEPRIPSYIQLSITQQALSYTETLRGEPMLSMLVGWLDDNADRVWKLPGRLSDIAKAVAGPEGDDRQIPLRQVKQTRPTARIAEKAFGPRSQQLLSELKQRLETPKQQKMLAARKKLPAWYLRHRVADAVRDTQLVIISGETGSGKSTQSPQFILDDMIERGLGDCANILCTQPRRISAMSLAERVAEERTGQVGEEIGYAIRGEARHKAGMTKMVFMTTGVLLRRLQTAESPLAGLADVTHVIVDEVHERSVDTDFLLILLRQALQKRPDLRVILMSATLDSDTFSSYFAAVGLAVAQLEVQGHTFPVSDVFLEQIRQELGQPLSKTQRQLEAAADAKDAQSTPRPQFQSSDWEIDYALLTSLVTHIDASLPASSRDSILIFLPGVPEINTCLKSLSAKTSLHPLPLHASLTPAEQRLVFPTAPSGRRKVIAATNVAETSITIPDVAYVIDTGRVKETRFDPARNMVQLTETWASQAACKQRRGRAGRVKPGKCYKLFTWHTHDSSMPARPQPEMTRIPLEQLVLSVKAMGVPSASSFLASTLSPPASTAVSGALEVLRNIGALGDSTGGEGDGELTALGRHLSAIPADLRLGKLLIYGTVFGCFDPALTIAATLTCRSPFLASEARREQAKAVRERFASGYGDLIGDARAFAAWQDIMDDPAQRSGARAWCEGHCIAAGVMRDISQARGQYLSSLCDIGFLPPDYPRRAQTALNAHADSLPLLASLIAGALHPNTLRILFPSTKFQSTATGSLALDPEARSIRYFAPDSSRVFVHPSSTLFSAGSSPNTRFPKGTSFVSYFTKMETSKVFVRDLTPVSAFGVMMFGGRVEVDTMGSELLIDGWMRIRGWARIGCLVNRLRGLVDGVLEGMIERPGEQGVREGQEVLDTVRRLVEGNGLDN